MEKDGTMARASEKKILIVDDEPDIRKFLSACIEDAGFCVDTAKDGIEALEKVSIEPPDLITLDLIMPRCSGVRVMRELRDNPRWAAIPVIIITAHARDELGGEDVRVLTAFTAGMRPRYTIEKPVSPEKLVYAIRDILDVSPQPFSGDQAANGDRENVTAMVRNSDPATLKKIRELINGNK